jgi:DNA-binding response OmpR family regulator
VVQILVAESDPVEALTLAGAFRRHGFDVTETESGSAAVTLSPVVDLVVLGLDLPDLDGLEVCRRIRLDSAVPIIATAERDTEVDIIVGLRAGMDAYLTRPVGLRELLARSQAILRRTLVPGASFEPISIGPLRINSQTREVSVCGRAVQLTRKEFDLLHLLAAQPETLFSRRHIMSVVWRDEWARSSRTIDTHVSSLRGKLGDTGAIQTVRGVGFRIGYRRAETERAPFPGPVLDVALT